MKKRLFLAVVLALSVTAALAQNPILQRRYGTPYEIPPFEKITVDNYREAMLKGMEQEKAEIQAIIDNKETPNFENVIVALSESGKLLSKAGIWSTINGASSTPELQELARELSPIRSAHSSWISMNKPLFEKVKYVYDHRSEYNLNKEEKTLLERTYKSYVKGGVLLSPDKQKELAELNLELSRLQLQFSQNLRHDTNNTYVIANSLKELEGLPQANIELAAALAEKIGQKGKWAFNMQRASCNPVLQYCKNRELRKKVYLMYNDRCNHNDEYDNKEIARQIVDLRLKKAKLMGYDNFAEMQLEDRMAEKSKNVYDLLDQIWAPAVAKANEELADIKAMMKKDKVKGQPQPWDYRYYLDKAKKEKFDIDEEQVSEYLEINNVQKNGVFYVANRLYGLSFRERTEDYPSFEPTAKSWDVIDREGNVIAIYYSDYFPRDGKGAGAWNTTFRSQSYDGAQRLQPIVMNCCNLAMPSAERPALQTIDNVTTMFHEFGHALHSFFRNVKYRGTPGTERDFVELPSQINEHWAFEPEVLNVYAKHYKTGEVIPQELIDKIEASSKYGQGFATVEYLAASYVDMDLHVLTEVPADLDVMKFQAEKLAERGIPKQILPRYSVTNFSHSMGGCYSAGYYSYIWAEVLDCDAYQAYKETGDIFNQEVAQRFRKYILTPGGIDKGSVMYRNFRGRDPQVDGLLENRGLK